MEPRSKMLAIILHSGALDRMHHAVSIALAGIANGMEVHVFLTYEALRRMTKEEVQKLSQQPSQGIKEDYLRSLNLLLQEGRRGKGLHLYACSASMALMRVMRDELVEDVKTVIGLASFLATAENAHITLFI